MRKTCSRNVFFFLRLAVMKVFTRKSTGGGRQACQVRCRYSPRRDALLRHAVFDDCPAIVGNPVQESGEPEQMRLVADEPDEVDPAVASLRSKLLEMTAAFSQPKAPVLGHRCRRRQSAHHRWRACRALRVFARTDMRPDCLRLRDSSPPDADELRDLTRETT